MVEVNSANTQASVKPANTAKPASENPLPVKPLPTNIKELYSEFEKVATADSSKGVKAKRIREIVMDIGKQLGKQRLALSAIHKIIKDQYPDAKVDRAYFNNIVKSTWDIQKDDKGIAFICLDVPAVKETK